jgi:nucleoside 2-deoxyribosyltransferase
MQYNVLVLGPMERLEGDTVLRESNTKRLGRLLQQISESLAEDGVPPFHIVIPDGQAQTVIEQMVLNEIEQADLVVIDLTGGRPNVAYEAAIIHTLGIPHIFASEDTKLPPFYFSHAQVILGLNLADDFGPAAQSPTQLQLRDKLELFRRSADARMEMAGNILTRHYGLPLVDLAGPAGLAVGYHINAVRRFIEPGGYSGRRCTLTIEQGRISRPASVFKARSKEVEVKALVVVEPPSQLKSSWHEDWEVITAALARHGVVVERGAIETVGEPAKRGFSGWFYSGGIRKGLTFCIDLPTTVYPLTESPRMRRLADRRAAFPGPQGRIIEEFEGRALERLLASFRRNLLHHVERVQDRRKDGFYYTDLAGLDAVLARLGVIA